MPNPLRDQRTLLPPVARTPLLALLFLTGGYFLAVHAFPRLWMTPAGYGDYYWPRRYWLLAHVGGGLLATLLGPLQFRDAVRRAAPALHRIAGRAYAAAVMLAGLTAFYLAATSAISRAYTIGLVLVTSLWLGSLVLAVAAARRRVFAEHRRWMLRNYTCTLFFIIFFAAYDLVTMNSPLDPGLVASVGVWVCWLIPLALLELSFRRRGRPATSLT